MGLISAGSISLDSTFKCAADIAPVAYRRGLVALGTVVCDASVQQTYLLYYVGLVTLCTVHGDVKVQH